MKTMMVFHLGLIDAEATDFCCFEFCSLCLCSLLYSKTKTRTTYWRIWSSNTVRDTILIVSPSLLLRAGLIECWTRPVHVIQAFPSTLHMLAERGAGCCLIRTCLGGNCPVLSCSPPRQACWTYVCLDKTAPRSAHFALSLFKEIDISL